MRKIIFSLTFFLFNITLFAAPPVASNGVMYSCNKELIAREFHDLTGDGLITQLDKDCVQALIMNTPIPPYCKWNTNGTGDLHFYDMNGSCEEPGHSYPCVTTLDLLTLNLYLDNDPVKHAQGLAQMDHVNRTYERRFCNNPPVQPCTADNLAQQALDLYDDGIIDSNDATCIQHYVTTGGYPGSTMPGCVPAERTPENYATAFFRYNQVITSTFHATLIQSYVLGMITAEDLPEVSQAAAIHNCVGGGGNNPPVFTTISSNDRYQFFTNQGIGEIPLEANDPDGSNLLLTYTMTGNPTGSSIIPGESPGTAIFQWDPNDSQIGDYSVTFTATDSGGASTNAFIILRSDEFGRAHFTPAPVQPIVLAGNLVVPPPGSELVVGTTFEMDIQLSPNLYGDTPWVAEFVDPPALPQGNPVAPSFSVINATTQRFAWNPDAPYPLPGVPIEIKYFFVDNPALQYYSAHKAIEYTYNFVVGGGLNAPPIITQPQALPSTFQVFSNELFALPILANDPEMMPLQNYTATSLSMPPLVFNWDPLAAPPLFSYTPTPVQETFTYQFEFTVDDNLGQTTTSTTAIDVFPFDFKVLKTPGDPNSNIVDDPGSMPVLTTEGIDPTGGGVIVQLQAPLPSPNHQNLPWTYTLTSVAPAMPPGVPSPTLMLNTGHLTFYNTTPYGNYDIGVEFFDGFNRINRLIRFNVKPPLEFTFNPAPSGGTPPDTYNLMGNNFFLNVGHTGGIQPVALSMLSTNLPGANYTWDAINGYLDIFNIGSMGSGPFEATFQIQDSQSPSNETIQQTIHFVIGDPPLAFSFTPAPTHGGPPLDTYYIQGDLNIAVATSGGVPTRNLSLIATTLPPAAINWIDLGDNGTLEINFSGLGSGPYTAQFQVIDSDSPVSTETFTLNFIVGPPPGFNLTLTPEPPGSPAPETYYVEEGTDIDIVLGHVNGVDPVDFEITAINIPPTNYRHIDAPGSPPGSLDLFQFSSSGLSSTISCCLPYEVTFRVTDSDSPTPQIIDRTIYIHIGLPGYAAWYDTQMRYAQFDNVLVMQPGNHNLYQEEKAWDSTVTLVNLLDFTLPKRIYTGPGSPYTNEFSLCKSNLGTMIGNPRDNWDLNQVVYDQDIYDSMNGKASFSRDCHRYLHKMQKYYNQYSEL